MDLDKRIPHKILPPYTNGWFQLAWSKDIGKKEVKTLKAFGEEIVLFRSEKGKLSALKPYCPHMGAHLGKGGKVSGESIRCPYHGWCFKGDGSCTHIPYSKNIPAKGKARSWIVEEKYGLVFILRNSDPYPLPEIKDFKKEDWSKPHPVSFKINSKMQEVMENCVDSPHFHVLHGHELPKYEFKQIDSTLFVKQMSHTKMLGFRIPATLEYTIAEPGFHYLEMNDLPFTKAVIFSSLIPIDENYCENKLTIFIKKSPIPFLSWIYKKFIISEMIRTYKEDMEIWENKIYLKSPVLCDGDGEIIKLRKWYSNFIDQGEIHAT